MLNTFMFDLDGTLLPMDAEVFERVYFQNLCQVIPEWEPKSFAAAIWASTKAMVLDVSPRTNQTVFFDDFKNRITHLNRSLDSILPAFDAFYRDSFHLAKPTTWVSPSLQQAVALLKQKGYTLAIATNPLFPESAVFQRIEWAGFDKSDFCHISTYEISHYCKPQLQYYSEILQTLEKQPEECMMVGNDTVEDTIAGQLGIATYLIEDCVLEKPNGFPPTHRGDSTAFLAFVQALPAL